LYDLDGNGAITKAEMYQIVSAIFAMTGKPDTHDDVTSRVNKIFEMMDADGNGELSREEFVDGARQDKSIVEAFSLYDGLV